MKNRNVNPYDLIEVSKIRKRHRAKRKAERRALRDENKGERW